MYVYCPRPSSPSVPAWESSVSRLENLRSRFSRNSPTIINFSSNDNVPLHWKGMNQLGSWEKLVYVAQGKIPSIFQKGLSYNAINIRRFVLSGTFPKEEGWDLGKHPLVRQFMRSAYHQRPPQPRLTHKWDSLRGARNTLSNENPCTVTRTRASIGKELNWMASLHSSINFKLSKA